MKLHLYKVLIYDFLAFYYVATISGQQSSKLTGKVWMLLNIRLLGLSVKS